MILLDCINRAIRLWKIASIRLPHKYNLTEAIKSLDCEEYI